MVREIEMYAYVDCFVILNIRSMSVYSVLESCLGVSLDNPSYKGTGGLTLKKESDWFLLLEQYGERPKEGPNITQS